MVHTGRSTPALFCAVLCLSFLVAGCSSDDPPAPAPLGSPTASVLVPFGSSGVSYGFEYPECAPDRIEMPGWVPTDLPLPEGTYATAVDDLGPGYNAGFFVIPEGNTIQSFIQLVGNDWQEAGYRLGQGDSEAEEVEALFSKPPATGSFKVQTTPCTDPAYLVMYLIYSPSDPEANQ